MDVFKRRIVLNQDCSYGKKGEELIVNYALARTLEKYGIADVLFTYKLGQLLLAKYGQLKNIKTEWDFFTEEDTIKSCTLANPKTGVFTYNNAGKFINVFTGEKLSGNLELKKKDFRENAQYIDDQQDITPLKDIPSIRKKMVENNWNTHTLLTLPEIEELVDLKHINAVDSKKDTDRRYSIGGAIRLSDLEKEPTEEEYAFMASGLKAMGKPDDNIGIYRTEAEDDETLAGGIKATDVYDILDKNKDIPNTPELGE